MVAVGASFTAEPVTALLPVSTLTPSVTWVAMLKLALKFNAGVKVTAFLVDHGPVKPAFGYRVDFREHSVAISGDTAPSENLVKVASGVDLLIHEVGRFKGDPALAGPPDELLPNSRQTRRQVKTIAEHHTDGVEVGRVLERVKAKLAVFSHYGVDPQATLPLIRRNYGGPVEFGEDSMTIEIGNQVVVRRLAPSR